VAETLSSLALVYFEQGEKAKAVIFYERALAIREKVFGPEDSRTAHIVSNLAFVYQMQEEYAKALPLYERFLVVLESRIALMDKRLAKIGCQERESIRSCDLSQEPGSLSQGLNETVFHGVEPRSERRSPPSRTASGFSPLRLGEGRGEVNPRRRVLRFRQAFQCPVSPLRFGEGWGEVNYRLNMMTVAPSPPSLSWPKRNESTADGRSETHAQPNAARRSLCHG